MCIYFHFFYFHRRGRYRSDRNRDKGILDDDNWLSARQEPEDEYQNLVSCLAWMIVALADAHSLHDVMLMKCVQNVQLK